MCGVVWRPHECTTNVLKLLETGRGQHLASAVCAVPSWIHSWNTEKPAAPPKPREMCSRCGVGFKIADPSINTEPGGLTASHSKQADIFTTAVVPGCTAAQDACVASDAAARGDPAPRHLIASCPTAKTKSRTCVTKASTIDILSGQQTGDHARPSHKQCSKLKTLHPAGTASRCQRNHSSADGDVGVQTALLRWRAAMTRAVLPTPSA